MGLTLITGPALEPITTVEAFRHCRLDSMRTEPVPTTPTVALAGAGAGNVDNGVHRYRLTYVTADGETNGGQISAAVTVADKTTNGKVALSAIPIGGATVIARNVYRTVAGGSDYFLVAALADNSTTSYTDTIADASLGVGIPTVNSTLDPSLGEFILAARDYGERFQNRAFVTQTWELSLTRFPAGCPDDGSGSTAPYPVPLGAQIDPDRPYVDRRRSTIRLPKAPLSSVTSIKYIDLTGAQQTLDPSTYLVDTTDVCCGELRPAYGGSWPLARVQPNAVTVRFVAGYGAPAAVPALTRQAIKSLVAFWYENPSSPVPASIEEWFWPERVMGAA